MKFHKNSVQLNNFESQIREMNFSSVIEKKNFHEKFDSISWSISIRIQKKVLNFSYSRLV